MMAKFEANNIVDFTRDGITLESIPIVAVVPILGSINLNHPLIQKICQDRKPEQFYIIEHPDGWTPDYMRRQKFGLSLQKKYLFVQEEELSE